jgi:short-subunit dehydrogenase
MSDKWALVTGASSGIGLEFSRQLASRGFNLVMVSNQSDALAKYSKEIHLAAGVEVGIIDMDLTDSDATNHIVSALKELGITPTLLINNAGIFDFKAVSDLTPKRINMYIDLHMRSVTLLSRAVGEMMAERGEGYILNMSSMSCWMPMPGIALYSATKAYIRAFSRALRVELHDSGVSVTVACPGGIATDLFGLPPHLQRLALRLGAITTPQRFVKKALNRTFKRRAQYINGFMNRLSIVAIAMLPMWGRLIIKRKLLDRLSKHDT